MLSAKRLHIEGRPQPIQMSEIAAYADFEEISDKAMREDLLHIVSVLDAMYLSHHLKGGKPPPASGVKPQKTGQSKPQRQQVNPLRKRR